MPVQYVFHELPGYVRVFGRLLFAQDDEIHHGESGYQFRPRPMGEQRLRWIRHVHDQRPAGLARFF